MRIQLFLLMWTVWLILSQGFALSSKRIFPTLEATSSFLPRRRLSTYLWVHPKTPFMAVSPKQTSDLDLQTLIEQVAAFTVTLRGRHVLLDMVQTTQSSPQSRPLGVSSQSTSRRRRAETESAFRRTLRPGKLAANAKEARKAFEIIEQARFVIEQCNPTKPSLLDDNTIPLPPFYGDEGPWNTKSVADTDDDEWLDQPTLEWSLHDILKAEKITERLLQLDEWLKNPAVQNWVPFLTAWADHISRHELKTVLDNIKDAVKIMRVKTATDPTGNRSFRFSLSEETFPILGVLRAKETDLVKRVDQDPSLLWRLDEIRLEIEEKEESIQRHLCGSIATVRAEIDRGLQAMGELDAQFAKAAFGLFHNGVSPDVRTDGLINVSGFVHPLLFQERAVPVDLRLSSHGSRGRALILSGPNGGGKTIALKSFGLVSEMVKLGIPIPVKDATSSAPRIDFFDEVLTSFGDHQSVETGQSTFMAKLSDYAILLEYLKQQGNSTESNTLVLLDELGSGTDADGGGAIGQAIVEEVLQFTSCALVATTHSPLLKAASFHDDQFSCASVSLKDNEGMKRPSYRLEYGVIGESFALDAASRTAKPSLPTSVLDRAAVLCREKDNNVHLKSSPGATSAAYLEALSSSLRLQNDKAKQARRETEEILTEMKACKRAMIGLAKNYNRDLGLLEARIRDCFDKLRQDESGSLELLGNTIEEIRVVRKRIHSDAERLKEHGLRLLPTNHILSDGEMVVVVDPTSPWDGAEGSVSLNDSSINEICVVIRIAPTEPEQSIMVPRHKTAIWDYDSIFHDNEEDQRSTSSPSREASKRRLDTVLASISSSHGSLRVADAKSSSFTSSRQRKAAAGKKKKRR